MEEQLKYYQNKVAYELDSWDLCAVLRSGEDVVVVDCRVAEDYHREHIPGALNLPYRAMDEKTTQHISKDALVVVYCDGVGCNASIKGALQMVRLGFNVKDLAGGLEWWRKDGYATQRGATGTEPPSIALEK